MELFIHVWKEIFEKIINLPDKAIHQPKTK